MKDDKRSLELTESQWCDYIVQHHQTIKSIRPGHKFSESAIDAFKIFREHGEAQMRSKYQDKKDKHKIQVVVLNKVFQFGAGEGFGELALINEEPRMATMVSASFCELISINKDDYKSVLQAREDKLLELTAEHLQSVNHLKHLDMKILKKLAYHVKQRDYERGNQVYLEGDYLEGIFIVREGTFLVSMSLNEQDREEIRQPLNQLLVDTDTDMRSSK